MKLRYYLSIFLLLSISILISCTKSDPVPTPTGSPLTDLKNIQYGASLNRSNVMENLLLDLYFPPAATTSKKYPLVMMIHGGSYINGDKDDVKGNSVILADSGFVVASINYRMGWNNGVGDCDGDTVTQKQAAYRALQDSNAALRFLMTNATKYAIDTAWVFTGGNSAGSSLSLNTAYITEEVAKVVASSDHTLLGSINTSGNALTTKFKIKGVCNMWGALPDSTLITITNALPTISFHGTNDTVVPYDYGHNQSCDNLSVIYGSICIHRQLLKYKKPVITNLVVGGGHGPNSYTHEFLMSNTACFFKRIMKGASIVSRVDKKLVSSCN
jgi:acetyl esterase/lipase